MKVLRKWISFVALGMLICGMPHQASAQEKSKSETSKAPEKIVIPLKVTLVLTEMDGEKKLSSLPYSFLVNTADRSTMVRNGIRVPVATGSFSSGATAGHEGVVSPLVNTQFTYIDVGTNIDCGAQLEEEGRYKLLITLDRSSIVGEPSPIGNLGNPVVRQFRSNFTLSLKDGQTSEGVMATDPLNGHMFRISVTVNAMK